MKFTKIIDNIFKIFMLFLIVLFVYFFVNTLILKCMLNVSVCISFLYDCFDLFIKYFRIFYNNWILYSDPYSVFNQSGFTLRYKNAVTDFPFIKFWFNLYFYPKLSYWVWCINIDEHNVMNRRMYWDYDIINLYASNKLTLWRAYSYHNVPLTPFVQVPGLADYSWGSHRYRVLEGDLTLMPDEFYFRVLKKFVRASFRFTNFLSGIYLYRSVFSFYENIYHDFLFNEIVLLAKYLAFNIYVYSKYKSLVTVFLFFVFSRFIINLNSLHMYLNTYFYGAFLSRMRNNNTRLLLSLMLLLLSGFKMSTFFQLFMIFFLWLWVRTYYKVIYSTIPGTWGLAFINKLFDFLKDFIRSERLPLKVSRKRRRSKAHKRLKRAYRHLFYYIYIFIYKFKSVFKYYFWGDFFNAWRLQKPYRKAVRRRVFFNLWNFHKINALINPLKYHDELLPVSLKGSRGGLWLRTTQKGYAKQLMYENRDALRFFRHKDNYRYFYWQSSYDFALHYFNQRDLLSLTSDHFFNYFFTGVRLVFTPSQNRAHIMGGVSHYENVHQFMSSGPVQTHIYPSHFAKLTRLFGLISYVAFMYVAPRIVKLVLECYLFLYYRLFYMSFFLSGWFRYQVEFTSYNVDPDYLPYLRFVEFYKLSSYLPFDYYLYKKFNYFLSDNRRHYHVYYVKDIDGWNMRYKMFELVPTAYFISNGGLHRAILAFVPIVAVKLSKWALLFHMHLPLEYFMFALVSFISKIWFFHKFFQFLDLYIYRCINVSIWTKRKFLLNTTRLRLQHGMFRTRWFRNQKLLIKLKKGRYLHARENNYSSIDLF